MMMKPRPLMSGPLFDNPAKNNGNYSQAGSGGMMNRMPFQSPRPANLMEMTHQHTTFDLHQYQNEVPFPYMNESPDDLTDALIQRNKELIPPIEENSAILNFVTKVQSVLDTLVLSAASFTACQVEETRQVGSFKAGTLLVGHKEADIVVILKTLPTKEAIGQLGNKLNDDVTKICTPNELITMLVTTYGIEMCMNDIKVKLLVTTSTKNINSLVPNVHLDKNICLQHLAAIRHAKWLEENASHPSIKVLIRLIKDLRRRFEAFQPLTAWMISLLAHHCVMNNPTHEPLPINTAFRRSIQLLSAGIFLPNSSGLVDPCNTDRNSRLHDPVAQDELCLTSQLLLRIMAHKGYNYILGVDIHPNLLNEISIWQKDSNLNASVRPGEKVYLKTSDSTNETELIHD